MSITNILIVKNVIWNGLQGLEKRLEETKIKGGIETIQTVTMLKSTRSREKYPEDFCEVPPAKDCGKNF